MSTNRPRRVAVIGGGIAGLTAGYRLTQASFDVVVLEAGERLGGKLAPVTLEGPGGSDGVAVEGGADSFVVRKPWAADMCTELGLGDELVFPGATGAAVWARGRLVPYPERSAFGIPTEAEGILRWPGLSFPGRLQAALDVYRPARPRPGDESIASLIGRRMGRECARVLVGPLLAGINSGDAEWLSVRATFPEVAEWERVHGSLIRGARAARKAAGGSGRSGAVRDGLFATVRGGLGRLVDELAAAIGPDRIRTGVTATGVSFGGAFEVTVDGERADPRERVPVDAVVVATPAYAAASLVRRLSAEAAGELEAIPYGSSAVVVLAYPPGSAGHLPDGTGCIVPPGSTADGERLTVTACTWRSRKWPDPQAFGDRAVVRAFVGRAGDEGDLERSDPEIVAAVARDIERISPLAEVPEAAGLVRWDRSMPQYEVGHLERVERIQRALDRVPGLFVTGSAYRGVGIADCVRDATETVERVRAHLEG